MWPYPRTHVGTPSHFGHLDRVATTLPSQAPPGAAEEEPELGHWEGQDVPLVRPSSCIVKGGILSSGRYLPTYLNSTHPIRRVTRARHFLQTGTVPATLPDSEWQWDAGEAQPLPGPRVLPLWYLPMCTLAHATRAVKGAFPQPLLPGVAEGRRRALEPLFPPGPGPGAAPRRGHGDRGMGGDIARHGVQVDHSGRPTAHAIAAGVPPPPTDGRLFGPPTRLYEGRVEGHTEPHQGVANEPGCTVPAGAGARTAHGPHTRGPPRPAQGVGSHGAAQRRGAGPGAGAAAGALPADPHPTRGHVQPPRPPGVAAPRRGRAPRRRGGTVANAPQPVRRGGPLVPTPTPLPTTGGPQHRRQNPYHAHPERRGAQGFPQLVLPALLPGQGPEALQQGPPLDTATTVQQRGRDGADGAEPYVTNCGVVAWMAVCRHLARDTTGLRQYRPTDRTALASTVAAVTMGAVAALPAQLLPHVPCRNTQPRRPAARHAPTAPLTAEQLYVVAAALLADSGKSFVHHHGPAQIAGGIQGPQCDSPDPWHATLRGRTRVWDAGDGTPPAGPQQGDALVLQTAGYQAILHGHAGGYRSHFLAGGCWTVWHSTARQGAFPPLPDVDWQQGPTQAYYMSADPWLLAVLLHNVSTPNKRQERGWVNLPALVWSPDQEEHLRAAWQGDAIRATDVLEPSRGRSRTPARRLPWRWPNGDSRIRSGWSARSARRTRTSSSATPKPWSAWQTAGA